MFMHMCRLALVTLISGQHSEEHFRDCFYFFFIFIVNSRSVVKLLYSIVLKKKKGVLFAYTEKRGA